MISKDAFWDELQKIAEASGESTQELIQDLSPRPRDFAERALPVAGTIGGTLGGSALGGALSRGGWRGMAAKGIGGVLGGMAGLGASGVGQRMMIQDRRGDAYNELRNRIMHARQQRMQQMQGGGQ